MQMLPAAANGTASMRLTVPPTQSYRNLKERLESGHRPALA
jgi:hypothetical protein